MILRKFNNLDENVFLHLFKYLCPQFYGAEFWLSFNNCSQVLKQFSIGYHKALKKIFYVSYRESNHFICLISNLLIFEHYINYLKISKVYGLLRNSCSFISKNKCIFLRGTFAKHIDSISKTKYGITSIFDNDLDAIRSRTWFVQNQEDPLR